MKPRYRLFLRRNSTYYAFDNSTCNHQSLRTKDKSEAVRLLSAMNEAEKHPAMNFAIAKIYLRHSESQALRRTWQSVLEELIKLKTGQTRIRWQTVAKDASYNCIRKLPVIETTAEHFFRVFETGTVCTNIFLRRMHNFALDMNWLSGPIIPRRQWPRIRFKERRAIEASEHHRILAKETNPERKAFYQICWEIGASQGDVARLFGEDVDWVNETLSFRRRKTDTAVIIHLGQETMEILRRLPREGHLFPYLATVCTGDRATVFRERCIGLGITGVTLHSYRYSWAERARRAGYPERFAQEALGHKCKAVHRAYARRAEVRIDSLESWERKMNASMVRVAFPPLVPSPASCTDAEARLLVGSTTLQKQPMLLVELE
jgi:integrase